ncbi:hemerythrin HHE cation binding domain protein [Ruegeria lacuscaerulensis ITI-1157]|nr:hemerythrin HHE cation binding domain protein [Ruegeria lacuscaerulensis ITI-1157]SHI54556.1 regulator of cell morphogenesis and NO signaling [Ruegeria lacuscaerulensis ITI-1157]
MPDHSNDHTLRETGSLIDFIISRYHAVHRKDLAKLQAMARHAAQVHQGDSCFPRGLEWALGELAQEMEDHMAKEEYLLFPLMRAGATLGAVHPIRAMRADHEVHAECTDLILRLTNGLTLPDHASGIWQALYAEIRRFLSDLAEHQTMENTVLFPRFEPH